MDFLDWMKLKALTVSVAVMALSPSCKETSEIEESKTYPVLDKDAPGVYDYSGSSWSYDEDSDQLSRLYKSGKVDFSILSPDSGKYVTISGMPEKPAVSEIFSVTLKENHSESVASTTLTVTVLKIEDDMVWMTTKDKVGIIAKF